MADSVAKGNELFTAAQKKLKSFSFFGESARSSAVCNCLDMLAGLLSHAWSGQEAFCDLLLYFRQQE